MRLRPTPVVSTKRMKYKDLSKQTRCSAPLTIVDCGGIHVEDTQLIYENDNDT